MVNNCMTPKWFREEVRSSYYGEIVRRALLFAEYAHEGQTRKYTGEPYINHPVAVASLVAKYHPYRNDMIIAALLHDTVEDTAVTQDEIRQKFGEDVAWLVFWLSDVSKPEDGNRVIRKEKDRKRISMAPAEAKTIKLADLIDNSSSIIKYDPAFAKIYMKEKELLLEVLKEGNSALLGQARAIVKLYKLYANKTTEGVS